MPTLQEQLIEAFRTRLETDPQLRREFEAAPLGTMRKAGLQVSPEKAQRLHLELKRGHALDLRPSAFGGRPFDMRAKRPT